MVSRRILLSILSVLLIASLAITGCDRSAKLRSVSDASGFFHVRVPSDWQSNGQPGLLALYSSDSLPETEADAIESLSIGLYTAKTAGTGPVDERLAELLDARAKDRGWKSSEAGKPVETKIGKRDGWSVELSGVDAQDNEFSARAALVRTNSREVLIFAVAPSDVWEKQSSAVDELFTEWYWHVPADQSTTETDTAPAE